MAGWVGLHGYYGFPHRGRPAGHAAETAFGRDSGGRKLSMSETSIAQTEADALIAMPKVKVNDNSWSLPITGGGVVIPLVSSNKRENFSLDISRGRVDLLKGKYQNRARQNIVLVRLDYGGAPHRNPDDQEISCPHLHIYREGFGDKWATLVPAEHF